MHLCCCLPPGLGHLAAGGMRNDTSWGCYSLPIWKTSWISLTKACKVRATRLDPSDPPLGNASLIFVNDENISICQEQHVSHHSHTQHALHFPLWIYISKLQPIASLGHRQEVTSFTLLSKKWISCRHKTILLHLGTHR